MDSLDHITALLSLGPLSRVAARADTAALWRATDLLLITDFMNLPEQAADGSDGSDLEAERGQLDIFAVYGWKTELLARA